MLYFAQPSSRTFLSFENACHLLGMKTSEIRDPNVSSEVKGESFDDSLRTFSTYTDLIIMRHKGQNMAERQPGFSTRTRIARFRSSTGGRATTSIPPRRSSTFSPCSSPLNTRRPRRKNHSHVRRSEKGRTVRSLSYLMKNFRGMKIIYAAPAAFQMKRMCAVSSEAPHPLLH